MKVGGIRVPQSDWFIPFRVHVNVVEGLMLYCIVLCFGFGFGFVSKRRHGNLVC